MHSRTLGGPVPPACTGPPLAQGVLDDFTRNDGIFIVRVHGAQAMITVRNDDFAMGRIPEQQERG